MAKKKVRRKIKTTLGTRKAFILTIFILAQVIFFYSPFFRLEKVEIIGNQFLTRDAILQFYKFPLGEHFFKLKLEKVKAQLDKLFWIKEVNLSWHFPGKLALRIVERHPAFLVLKENSNQYFIASSDGMILKTGRSEDSFPKIVLEDEIKLGKIINLECIKGVSVCLDKLPVDFKNKIDYFKFNRNFEISIISKFPDKSLEIKLGTLDNIEEKLAALKELFLITENNKVIPRYIDLRFKEAIIKI
ncbi:MAG: FtsQ-type POTRA domain-containing protein [Armatimonadetes bacterium]|nr:FtsQ-type POTRA domain-containing protein [Armatimonadota bacterium]